MFLIFGIDTRFSNKIFLSGEDGVCNQNTRWGIFIEYMCFSLFFIPVFKWGKTYYLTCDNCKKKITITKEEHESLKQSMVMNIEKYIEKPQPTYEKTSENQNEFCPVCKKEMKSEYTFCPHCGQRQR